MSKLASKLNLSQVGRVCVRRRRRRRRGHPLGRPSTADVLAARPRRKLADHRPAVGL